MLRIPLLRRALVGLSISVSLVGTATAQTSRTVTAADMPRIPHVDVNDVLKTFSTAAGFSVELVAAEPLVSDPVDACFDEFGRMYVAEMHGYPFSHEPTKLNPEGGGKKDAGIIRLLEDTDDDGEMDRSTVFADGLNWPTSVCCFDGGIFVLAPQHLYYLKDSTGDGKADVREVILKGFGRGNVQSVTNGLQWGHDNRIYFAAGRNSKDLTHRGQPFPPVGSNDLRFDPKTETFETVTGGLQFGHTQDIWGTRFVCSNSNHMLQVVFPQGYLSRNPFYVASNSVRSVATDGASAPVFRKSPPEPWRIVRQKWRALDKGYRLEITAEGGWEFIPVDPSKKAGAIPTEYPVGFFTSATGITIYTGNAYPQRFRGNAFVGDVGGNLIHRKTVDDSKVVYRSSRADEGAEIVASSDNWFRPVNFVNAPDGSLYALDMYRETIEHPYSIPQEIKAFLDLSSGDDRGRIYRLVSPDMQRHETIRLGDLDDQSLVAELNSENGWNRRTAQRLIWERQGEHFISLIEQLLRSTASSAGKVHAMCALNGLDALSAAHVRIGFADKQPRVRQYAVRLAETLLSESPDLLPELAKLSTDESEHVRFQVAFTLGESSSEIATAALADMCRDQRNGPEVQTAIYSSVRNTAEQIAAALIKDGGGDPALTDHIVAQLAIIVGSNPETVQAFSLLENVVAAETPARQVKLISALGTGLTRRGATIMGLIDSAKCPTALRTDIYRLFANATDVALDESVPNSDRVSAVELLAFAPARIALQTLSDCLSSRSSQPLQKTAIRSLGAFDDTAAADIMLSAWRTYSPAVRADIVDKIMTRPAHILRLLVCIESGVVKGGDIGRSHKQQLLTHRDKNIKSRSIELLEQQSNTNRAAVVDSFAQALELAGTVSDGKAVFRKHCSVCHRVGDLGHQVAPDLASVKNKSAADLLIAILDPNREGQPNYNTYTVITEQGKNYTGIIASETASSITLKRAEAKTDVILRSNIDELSASGVSLMPEGFEKDISPQQMANVIAFIKSIGNPVN